LEHLYHHRTLSLYRYAVTDTIKKIHIE